MIKNLKRICVIALVLIGFCYNFCYADGISFTPTQEIVSLILVPGGGLFIGLIGLLVLIISIIALCILKVIAKKNNNIDLEKNEKKISKNRKRIYVCAIIVFSVLHLTFYASFDFGFLIFLIPIIGFIISILIRKHLKKISNIICIISICIICIIPIAFLTIEYVQLYHVSPYYELI